LNVCSTCGGIATFLIGGPISALSLGNADQSHQVYNFGDFDYLGILNWTHGSHSFKFGSDTETIHGNYRDTNSQGSFGCYNPYVCQGNGFSQTITANASLPNSGLSIATFLLGDVSDFGREVYAVPLPPGQNLIQAFFAQDTWRAKSNLTVTLGLRWDYLGKITSSLKGGVSNFNFTNANTIIANYGTGSAKSSPTADVDNNYNDWGPRIGLAYRLGGQTVLRGGYARSYNWGFFGANYGTSTGMWPVATRQDLIQTNPYEPIFTLAQGPPPVVPGFQILAAHGNPAQYPTPNTAPVFAERKRNPDNSTDMWNVAVQHDFPGKVTVTASYVGNTNRYIFYRINANTPAPGQGFALSEYPYNVFGYDAPVFDQTNKVSSSHQSVQLSAEKRNTHGLYLTGAFTYNTGYDYGLSGPESDQYDLSREKGPPNTQRRFVFVFSHIYDLPFGPGKPYLNSKGPLEYLVGGWSFSGIWTLETGQPFSPLLANTISLDSPCCGLRADVIGNPHVPNPTRKEWFNPAAFAVPGPGLFGNAGRDSLWGPSFFNADLSLAKQFKLPSEKVSLQLMLQAFNVFNHTQLGLPNNYVDPGNPVAGTITSIAGQMRILQLGVKVNF
jgi:outer membrane receptor protein involved in Fe transport